MTLNNLEDLFVEQLRDLYSAETQILDALPEMVDASTSDELRKAFESHLKETRNQKQRLEKIFESLGEDPEGETCKGMKGLLEEGSEMLEKDGDASVIDAGIIAAAQRVEHYEISGYGTARTYAERLGHDDAVELIDETLDEESAANEKLTKIAESTVNPKATAGA